MNIGGFDTAERVLIVAEIGNNHEGSYERAKKLVRAAAAAGADAVKFQTYRTELFVSGADKERFDRLKSFELSPAQFAALAVIAKRERMAFLSTPLDLKSARSLRPFVDAYKIASGDNNFFPLIDWVAGTGKPVILSGGMATARDLKKTVARIARIQRHRSGEVRTMALHCVTSYPVPPGQENVGSVAHMSRTLSCPVGYSDHTLGIEASVLAVAAGARLIEKHFTLDNNTSAFRDHKISADPLAMSELVRRIRRAESVLGLGQKIIQPCERPFMMLARRQIVSARNLSAGARLTWADLLWTRPAGGMLPGQEKQLVGRRLKRDIAFGEPFGRKHVE